MKSRKYYCSSMPVTFLTKEEWLDLQYSQDNMIKKSDLKNRTIYLGKCRNSLIAIWIEELDLFVYPRTKFGQKFLEDIEHPENDRGFDVFIPHVELDEVLNSPVGVIYFEDSLDFRTDAEKGWRNKKEGIRRDVEYLNENLEKYIEFQKELQIERENNREKQQTCGEESGSGPDQP